MTMVTKTFNVRAMQAQDLAGALALTQGAGWPHQADDWRLHFNHGRGWVACDEAGKVIGTTLLWEFGDGPEIGTLGLIVVDPAWQGHGIGRLLVTEAIKGASANQLRLMSTLAGFKLYQSCGFVQLGTIEQRQGIPEVSAALEVPTGIVIRDVQASDLHALVALDQRAFGCPRTNLLTELLELCRGVVLEQNGVIQAFALIRRGGRGLQIGPLVGGSEEQAKILLSRLIKEGQGFTRIDIPQQAQELGRWLDIIGLKAVDTVTAMQRGGSPQAPAQPQTLGLVSQAFG